MYDQSNYPRSLSDAAELAEEAGYVRTSAAIRNLLKIQQLSERDHSRNSVPLDEDSRKPLKKIHTP